MKVTTCVGLSLSMLDTNTPYGAVVPHEVLRPLGTGTLTKVRDGSSRPGASLNSGNITWPRWVLFTELRGQAAFCVTARDHMTFFLPSETAVWMLPRGTSLCPHVEVHCDERLGPNWAGLGTSVAGMAPAAQAPHTCSPGVRVPEPGGWCRVEPLCTPRFQDDVSPSARRGNSLWRQASRGSRWRIPPVRKPGRAAPSDVSAWPRTW